MIASHVKCRDMNTTIRLPTAVSLLLRHEKTRKVDWLRGLQGPHYKLNQTNRLLDFSESSLGHSNQPYMEKLEYAGCLVSQQLPAAGSTVLFRITFVSELVFAILFIVANSPE